MDKETRKEIKMENKLLNLKCEAFVVILCRLHTAHIHNQHQNEPVNIHFLNTVHYVAKSARLLMYISTVCLTLTSLKEFSVMGFCKLEQALFAEINILCVIYGLFI